MSRKVSAILAGWLAAASIGLAQSGQPSNPAAGKSRQMSPYYPTASTVDWAGEALEPPEMPILPVPRAPSPIRTVAGRQDPQPGTQPPPMNPPVTTPVTPAPAAPAAPGTAASALPPGAPGVAPNNAGSCPNGCATAPGTNCCPCPNGVCGPEGRFWVSGEYLLWWTRGMNVPPLVTSSPAGTPRNLAGVLGGPGTVVLFGGDEVNDDVRSGFRLRTGFWIDQCQLCGLEGSFFFLGRNGENETFECPPGNVVIIARPFFNAAPTPGLPPAPIPDSELVCLPGILNGSVNVDTSTELYGFDANFRKNLCCACDYRIDGVVGYRYLNLKDRVNITESLTVTAANNAALPFGTTFLVQDRFHSTNEFNGGQVGVVGEWRRGRWYFGSRSMIALGNTHSEVVIDGFTRVSVPGSLPTQNVGGLLAQPTNIGRYTSNQFSVVPESSMTVGYQVTDGIRAFIGYTYLYWTDVTRAGDQIDLVVNATQIPPGTLVGPARPAFPNRQTDFWAQGISFGVEVRY